MERFIHLSESPAFWIAAIFWLLCISVAAAVWAVIHVNDLDDD